MFFLYTFSCKVKIIIFRVPRVNVPSPAKRRSIVLASRILLISFSHYLNLCNFFLTFYFPLNVYYFLDKHNVLFIFLESVCLLSSFFPVLYTDQLFFYVYLLCIFIPFEVSINFFIFSFSDKELMCIPFLNFSSYYDSRSSSSFQ